jgi:citrate synthase
MTNRKATLSLDGDLTVDLPILEGTKGQDVIDISSLGGHGYFTYDPGFSATAACQSDITYIDGGKGILLHRGYPIEQLAEKSRDALLRTLLCQRKEASTVASLN